MRRASVARAVFGTFEHSLAASQATSAHAHAACAHGASAHGTSSAGLRMGMPLQGDTGSLRSNAPTARLGTHVHTCRQAVDGLISALQQLHISSARNIKGRVPILRNTHCLTMPAPVPGLLLRGMLTSGAAAAAAAGDGGSGAQARGKAHKTLPTWLHIMKRKREETQKAAEHAHALRRAQRDGVAAPPSARAAAAGAAMAAAAAADVRGLVDDAPLGTEGSVSAATAPYALLQAGAVAKPSARKGNKVASNGGTGRHARVWPMEPRELTAALTGSNSLHELALMLGPPPPAVGSKTQGGRQAHDRLRSDSDDDARSTGSNKSDINYVSHKGDVPDRLRGVWSAPMGLRMRAARAAAVRGPLPPICLTAAATTLRRLSLQAQPPRTTSTGAQVARGDVLEALRQRLSWDLEQYGDQTAHHVVKGAGFRRSRQPLQLDARAVASVICALGVTRLQPSPEAWDVLTSCLLGSQGRHASGLLAHLSAQQLTDVAMGAARLRLSTPPLLWAEIVQAATQLHPLAGHQLVGILWSLSRLPTEVARESVRRSDLDALATVLLEVCPSLDLQALALAATSLRVLQYRPPPRLRTALAQRTLEVLGAGSGCGAEVTAGVASRGGSTSDQHAVQQPALESIGRAVGGGDAGAGDGFGPAVFSGEVAVLDGEGVAAEDGGTADVATPAGVDSALQQEGQVIREVSGPASTVLVGLHAVQQQARNLAVLRGAFADWGMLGRELWQALKVR